MGHESWVEDKQPMTHDSEPKASVMTHDANAVSITGTNYADRLEGHGFIAYLHIYKNSTFVIMRRRWALCVLL